MSFEAMTWAVKQKVPAMQKIVLLMLANRTSPDTGVCYPSHDKLANDCGMTKRSVIQQIEKLERTGLVFVERRMSEKTKNKLPNFYRLNIENLGTKPPPVVNDVHKGSELNSLGVVNDVHKGSELNSLGVVNDVHIKQSIETVKETHTHGEEKTQQKTHAKKTRVCLSIDDLNEEQQACREWGLQHHFWSSQVENVAKFVTLYNSKSARGIKKQFEEYRANEGNEQVQKNQPQTTNHEAGFNGTRDRTRDSVTVQEPFPWWKQDGYESEEAFKQAAFERRLKTLTGQQPNKTTNSLQHVDATSGRILSELKTRV